MTEKQAILLLWYLVNASPSAFWKLYTKYGNALTVLGLTLADWQALAIHKTHTERFKDYKQSGHFSVFDACMQSAKKGEFHVVFFDDVYYPKQFEQLVHRPPLLFLKGNKQCLNMAQIAMVGTRKPSQSAQKIAQTFATSFATEGMWVISGLADGIDKYSHIGALKQGQGRTVAVLGSGIDICYPKQNMALYQQIINEGGAVLSELLPGSPPQAHNFPRRNRLVSGLSIATLVVEAAKKSGSLITAGYAAEQGKLVFAIPGHIHNTQAQGCHQLIREGAILVDSAEQVIEDINLPRRIHQDSIYNLAYEPNMSLVANNNAVELGIGEDEIETTVENPNATPKPVLAENNAVGDISPHLLALLNQLDWVGQDMDKLIQATALDASTLASQLMELELSGLVIQVGGLYQRCRQ